MNNLFNPDNKFFAFMTKVANLIILNILCLICCLPIVTLGASVTALYYMTMKMVRNEETYIVKGFFHSFRQNLKQSIVINLIMLLLGLLLIFDFYFARKMSGTGTFYTVLGYVFLFLMLLYAMVLTYIYPMLAKFYNSVGRTFKNALLLSIRHLPQTLLMIAIAVIPPLAMIYGSAQFFSTMLMIYALLGFAVIAYINSTFLVKIFDKYIPQEETPESSEDANREVEIDASVFTNLKPTNVTKTEEIETTENSDDNN